jgi:hypothetical protein
MTTVSLHHVGPGAILAHRHRRSRAERVSRRERRTLISWLRRTAAETRRYDPIHCRYVALRRDRLSSAWSDLSEIATMLEHAPDPDPVCVAELRELVRNGGESPLYDSGTRGSELRATLYFVRSRLSTGAIARD